MKKEYINPQTDIFQLVMENPVAIFSNLATSPAIDEDDNTDFASF